MLTLASRLCFLSAIGLLMWAIISIVVSSTAAPPREALFIEKPEQDVGQQPVGAHLVTFRVRNTTQRPQQIIGMTDG
ncbi:MAG TPA: hypothetical protein VFE62_28300 [Gemmataceae bacterium]|nr:hypothetical protein [Gemmataceae bacterium]